MSVAIAVPFDPFNYHKLAHLVTKCCEHRNWFNDSDWALGEAYRREMVLGRLSALDSKTWEVYRDGEFVGILHADNIVFQQDCRAHFIFFDRELTTKRQLCLNTMQWLFDNLKLECIRVEIPTYAAKLVGFVRKALHFKWESEERAFSWPSSAEPLSADAARLGSRKHHAILHNGQWHDLLLLSVTRNEFASRLKEKHDRTFNETSSRRGTIAQPACA